MNSEELYKNIVHYTNETSVVNIINDITGLSNEEIDKLRE
jgi:hypothetical protein